MLLFLIFDKLINYESKTKKGYEIPFTRHFYKYVEIGDAEQTLHDIEAFGRRIQAYITKLFGEV